MEPGRFHLFLFYVLGNSVGTPWYTKRHDLPTMRTRAMRKFVASDRARRENVPRHILFYGFCSRHLFTYGVQITGIPL